VVGINTAINPNGKGIGFAIPSDALRDVLPQLETTGHVSRGRLGVAIQPVDLPLAKALGLDRARGALVGDVEAGGPADKVGMKSGDVILSVDGADVAHAQDLPRIVARHAPGSIVHLSVIRDHAPKTIDVTLDALREQGAAASHGDPSPDRTPGLGLELGDAPNGGAQVQRITPGSDLAEQVQPGDVITEVNRVPVATAADATRQLQATSKGAPVLLKVRDRRGGRMHYVAIERR
jgi:serine protease Do